MKNLLRIYKNNKFYYYLRGAYLLYYPAKLRRNSLFKKMIKIEEMSYDEADYIRSRVSYYNKVNKEFDLDKNTNTVTTIKDFRRQSNSSNETSKTYFIDAIEYLKYFNENYLFSYRFGDVTQHNDQPTIVKSRPVCDNDLNGFNDFSVLLNLNKVRHFNFINDHVEFSKKINKLVWRGAVYQAHRKSFVEKFYNHPLCDIGQTNNPDESQEVTTHHDWQKPFMPIREQLKYKFILCIEGNDVATNLKWAMSSNSLCLMTKPKFETWFMEGKLIAGKHYVEISDDYSDLINKIEYYQNHDNEALEIIKNAQQYTKQFANKQREDLISLLVLNQYFLFSNM